MITVSINTIPVSFDIFNVADRVFEIHVSIDLQDSTVLMGHNTVLRFIEGSFSNGKIRGNDSYIESSGRQPVFFGVDLEGQWRGHVHDLLFSYNEAARADFTPILASLLCFERIDLYRDKYYLQWDRIGVDTNQDIDLDGHGAIWYISSDKGDVDPWDEDDNIWGPKYETWVLISYYYYVRKVFRVRNLIIEDNHETIPDVSGYGEFINYSKTPNITNNPDNPFPNHVMYSLFEGLASNLTEFDNIKYDGGGEFFKAYNQWVDADRLVFRNCDLHTGGFAVEVLNEGHNGTVGRLNEALFDNCVIHNHLSRFVGVLSFVDEGQTKRLKIINSKICGYPGNLEVSGVEQVLVDNSIFVNHGLCSQKETGPCFYKCTNSQFYLTAIKPDANHFAFAAMGDHVYLENNHFYMTRYMVFSNINRLHLYNNVFVVPTPTNYILVANASAKIGYYGNNRVSCPRVENNHISLRLDTTYVMAQYEPFTLAFKNNCEEDIFCYTFNWSNNLMTMAQLNNKLTELHQSVVTLDNEGYAVGYYSPAELSTSVVNNTVSITLIGKSYSALSGEYTLVSSLDYTTPFCIRVSQQSVFRVYMGSQLIADIPRHTEDVRMDVTITKIHDCFEIFVFLDKELFAKYSCPEDGQDVPTSLSFSPNFATAIKAIRFVPGGFILDELEPVMPN